MPYILLLEIARIISHGAFCNPHTSRLSYQQSVVCSYSHAVGPNKRTRRTSLIAFDDDIILSKLDKDGRTWTRRNARWNEGARTARMKDAPMWIERRKIWFSITYAKQFTTSQSNRTTNSPSLERIIPLVEWLGKTARRQHRIRTVGVRWLLKVMGFGYAFGATPALESAAIASEFSGPEARRPMFLPRMTKRHHVQKRLADFYARYPRKTRGNTLNDAAYRPVYRNDVLWPALQWMLWLWVTGRPVVCACNIANIYLSWFFVLISRIDTNTTCTVYYKVDLLTLK
jgi:hypothetical protein